MKDLVIHRGVKQQMVMRGIAVLENLLEPASSWPYLSAMSAGQQKSPRSGSEAVRQSWKGSSVRHHSFRTAYDGATGSVWPEASHGWSFPGLDEK